jgi:hypothetical protein
MKFWDIIRSVGGGIIENAVPGGNIIMGAINGLLPPDKQLPLNATGQQAQDAIAGLTPELQAQVKNKEFDVKIEQIKQSYDTLRTMLTSDAVSPHSTRPYIAKGSFQVIAFTVVTVISTWTYGVIQENDSLVQTVMSGWPFILAVIAPLVVLLHAYFGVLKQEQKNKLEAATGNKSMGVIGGIISALTGRK